MINNRYSIKRKIGEGRSKVFLCSDNEFPENEIALKIFSPDAALEELIKFEDEFFTLRKLNHPNIIKVNELGTIVKKDDSDKEINTGSGFISFEYFDGVELDKYEEIKNEETLISIIQQISSVLYYLHQSNFIYYDLKPGNILLKKVDDKPLIKLIDFGFVHNISKSEIYSAKGTAEYIAPEILKKAFHDHRVDFYSFGIMLYKLIYGNFPFSIESELEIYKAHIEKEFDFPKTNISNKIINVVKKLLKKDPNDRYLNSLQILDDLSVPIDKNITKDFIPARTFSDRKDSVNILNTYINDKSSNEVFSVRGFGGSGKSALLEDVYSRHPNSVLISGIKSKSGINFIYYLIKKIIYTDFIYPNLSDELRFKIERLISDPNIDFKEELKSIFTNISLNNNFILLLDDYNNYGDFTLDILNSLIPILQVNKIKVILSENSDFEHKADELFNLKIIGLNPFTEAQLIEYLDSSFYQYFPKSDLKKAIILYADLLPGSVDSFIKDLILLEIIEFHPDQILVKSGEKVAATLNSSQNDIYQLRLNLLSDNELKTAQTLASLNIGVDSNILSNILELDRSKLNRILSSLSDKNIIYSLFSQSDATITSDGLKRYIYKNITDKKDFHSYLAGQLRNKVKDFNKLELARQYELAEKFETSYEILLEEIDKAERMFSYSYQKNLYNHILNFPLDNKTIKDVKFKLCNVYYKLSEFMNSLEIAKELLQDDSDDQTRNELLIIKGSSLIELRELEEGKELLLSLIDKIKDENRKLNLMIQIAYAEFDLNNFDKAVNICTDILLKSRTHEIKANCYNLLGLVEFYQNNDLDKSLEFFLESLNLYEKAKSTLQEVKLEGNIGNIYNIKGDKRNAEKYWNKALNKNLSIGNLDQEAKHSLNYGIYYFDNLQFEEAIKQYKRAFDIFSSLGNKNGQVLVLNNLGEVNLIISDYQESFNAFSQAEIICKQLINPEEEAEVLFSLGKFYFSLGNSDSLKKISNYYSDLIKGNNLPERHKNNLAYLNFLQSCYSDNVFDIDNLIKIRNEFLEHENKTDYANANFLLVKLYIDSDQPKKAFDHLNNKIFRNICESKRILLSKLYLNLSRIAAINLEELELKTPIDYLTEAFEIISDQTITETTWEITFELAQLYFERGNLVKAKEFSLYTRELILFFAEKIKNNELRKDYLAKLERKFALEKINQYASQF